MRETYPSVAEELFSTAFTRLKRIAKEKQDALESYKKGINQNVEEDDHRRPDKSSSYQSQRTLKPNMANLKRIDEDEAEDDLESQIWDESSGGETAKEEDQTK